jgi:alpha-ribazole phosphatase
MFHGEFIMRLLIARHGQTKHNLDHRYQGMTDAPLNETGRSQAVQLADRLAGEKIDVIYSSPLMRSVQTAELLAKIHKLDIKKDERLREISFGEWEGMSYDEIHRQSPDLLEKWINDPAHVPPPNGETLIQLATRVKSVVDEIKPQHVKDTVLLVTHGGVIRTLLCLSLGLDLNRHAQFESATGSISELSFYEEGVSLKLFNGISHLGE